MWNGRAYVIAVDYKRYIIAKFCSLNLSERKYVHCECFKCTYDKMKYIMPIVHFSNLLLGFLMADCISILPTVLPRASNY